MKLQDSCRYCGYAPVARSIWTETLDEDSTTDYHPDGLDYPHYGDPVWPGVRKYSADWRRRYRAWYLDRYPEADECTRRNLDMLVIWAEENERLPRSRRRKGDPLP